MITSLANGRVKRIIALKEKSRIRSRENLFVAEGIKMFEEAPIGILREIYCSERFYGQLEKVSICRDGKGKQDTEGSVGKCGHYGARDEERCTLIWKKLNICMQQGIYVEQVSEEVFKRISDTQTPQGILFVMEQLSCSLEDLVMRAVKRREERGKEPLFLLLEDIQDPGNLGTMVRTGEGAGVDGVIMSKGTADIYNPKAIRSTMGSLYRVPFLYIEELGRAVALLKQNHITVYAAHLDGNKYFDEISYKGGSAFLVGNEGNGLKKETADLADVYLKIPMEGKLESLNAAVAAALLLYRAAGDRRKAQKGMGEI